MSKHTPGPWIVLEGRHPYNDGNKAHVERNIYTQRIDPQLKDHYPVVCQSVGVGRTGEKAVHFVHIEEADARLIAAAPELLAALNEIVSQIDQGGAGGKVFSRDACIMQARAAIAKATGGAA